MTNFMKFQIVKMSDIDCLRKVLGVQRSATREDLRKSLDRLLKANLADSKKRIQLLCNAYRELVKEHEMRRWQMVRIDILNFLDLQK